MGDTFDLLGVNPSEASTLALDLKPKPLTAELKRKLELARRNIFKIETLDPDNKELLTLKTFYFLNFKDLKQTDVLMHSIGAPKAIRIIMPLLISGPPYSKADIKLIDKAESLEPNIAFLKILYSIALTSQKFKSEEERNKAYSLSGKKVYEAVELEPSNLNFRHLKVKLLIDLGDLEYAEKKIKWLISKNFYNGETYNLLAVTQYINKDINAAIVSLKKSIQLMPNFSYPYINLNRIYSELKEPDKALYYLGLANSISTNNDWEKLKGLIY